MPETFSNYIGGAWVAPANREGSAKRTYLDCLKHY